MADPLNSWKEIQPLTYWLSKNREWTPCTNPVIFAYSARPRFHPTFPATHQLCYVRIHLYRGCRQSSANASVCAMRNRIMSKKIFILNSHGDCRLVSQIDINQRLTIINAKLHHKRRRTAVWGCLVEDLICTGASERLCLGNDDSWDANNNRALSYKG